MLYLKGVTEDSWLIADTEITGNVGILSRGPDGRFFLLLGEQRTQFENEDELNTFFDCKILDLSLSRVTERNKRNFINGYPVDEEDIHIVDDIDTKLPIFKKTEKSKALRCAGYYVIHYANGWLDMLCPKYETLDKYEYVGPFKTESQAQTQLLHLKKQKKTK